MRRFLRNLALLTILTTGTTTMVRAEVQTKAVEYNHDGQKLKGFLAWDDSISGNRPGVLLVHEWWGLNDYAKGRAKQLAELGYVAFALDMYGEGKVTNHPTQASQWLGTISSNTEKWRNRALAGLDVLKQQPGVDPNNLAAIGYCFGGSTVIHLAYADAPVKGVASFHGALVPPPVGGKVNPRIAVYHGGADSLVPPATVDAFSFGMEQIKGNYTLTIFGGAKHGFTNPKAGDYGVDALGYNKQADETSWAMLQLFLNEIFSKSSPAAPVK